MQKRSVSDPNFFLSPNKKGGQHKRWPLFIVMSPKAQKENNWKKVALLEATISDFCNFWEVVTSSFSNFSLIGPF